MHIALRWIEEPFECEFGDAERGGTLRVFADGELVWNEIVRSAANAVVRAREVKDLLLARARQRQA